ncbi:hypothetical protein O5D80_000874 [Batrachochytrium dendrobatidis]|nr:hypothetical protein O5D80_000874 [Batrachochytrium dendrobatidis]
MIAVILIYSFLISGIFAGLDDLCPNSIASTSDQAPSTSGQRQSRPPTGAKKNRCFTKYLHLQGPCRSGELESYDEAISTMRAENERLLGRIKKTKRGIMLLKFDQIQLDHETDEQLASLGYTRESVQRMLADKLKSANILLRLISKLYRKQLDSMMKIEARLSTRQCSGIRNILSKTSKYFKLPKMVSIELFDIFGDPQGGYVSMFPKMARTVGISRPDEATQTTEPDQSTETDIQVD